MLLTKYTVSPGRMSIIACLVANSHLPIGSQPGGARKRRCGVRPVSARGNSLKPTTPKSITLRVARLESHLSNSPRQYASFFLQPCRPTPISAGQYSKYSYEMQTIALNPLEAQRLAATTRVPVAVERNTKNAVSESFTDAVIIDLCVIHSFLQGPTERSSVSHHSPSAFAACSSL